jgi:hypothetical protein
MRSLDVDGFHRFLLGLFFTILLLGAWLTWFFLGRIVLYESRKMRFNAAWIASLSIWM